MDGGEWCKGYVLNVNNINEKLTGLFPVSKCWKLNPVAYLKHDNITSTSKTNMLKFAQVIHGMTAQLDEEIDLVEGQQVVITEFIDKDWYRCEFLILVESNTTKIFCQKYFRKISNFYCLST